MRQKERDATWAPWDVQASGIAPAAISTVQNGGTPLFALDFPQRLQARQSRLFTRINDDGTNLNYSFSCDGTNFVQLFTELRAAFIPGGPNQVGFGGDTESAANTGFVTLISWTGAP